MKNWCGARFRWYLPGQSDMLFSGYQHSVYVHFHDAWICISTMYNYASFRLSIYLSFQCHLLSLSLSRDDELWTALACFFL
jgi:hypothetical protein